jgi:hypothetical protein
VFLRKVLQLLVTANVPSMLILFTLMMEAVRYFLPKRWLLQEPRGVTSQKATSFIVTALNTSHLTQITSTFSLSALLTDASSSRAVHCRMLELPDAG